METLGDLWDKITILNIRISAHESGEDDKREVIRELKSQKDYLANEFDEVWEHGGKHRAYLKHKLRTSIPTLLTGLPLETLKGALYMVNHLMWDNEAERDAWLTLEAPTEPALRNLSRCDRMEQKYNQTRSAIIDQINKRGLEKWANVLESSAPDETAT